MLNFPIGERVRIKAIKNEGSARKLNGLTGTIVGPHPIAANWLQLKLDPNPVTPYREWTIASDRLVLCSSTISDAA